MYQQQVLSVGDGVQFTYLDSGVPRKSVAGAYTTLIATHGLAYNAHTFTRVMSLASDNNLRIVAVNRRCYGGSTPFTPESIAALETASAKDKEEFVRSTGSEFATFVEQLIKSKNIPSASPDGKSGGVVFLGWSAGHGIILSALANLEHFPPAVQASFKSHVRTLIMQEPPAPILGLPLPPGAWFFEMDMSIPEEQRRRMGTIWITSYFDHGDLSLRSTDVLQYIQPSIYRAPSIYSMSREEIAAIIDENVSELPIMGLCHAQAHDNYIKTCFNKTTRALMPHLTIHTLCGDKGPSFSPAAHWNMQDDDEKLGKGSINFTMIPGTNHFMHWDEPELAIKSYLQALQR